MLHSPEDRRALRRDAEKAEAWAEGNTGILAEHLRGSSHPLIAYGAGGLPAAHALSLATTILLEAEPILLPADEATYHILPYRTGLKITLFSALPRDSSAYRLLETARLVGHRVAAVMPPPPEELEERMRIHTLIHPPLRATVLAEAMLALKAAYTLAPRSRGRQERLGREVGSLAEIHGELWDRYAETAEEILLAAEENAVTVSYTPSMMGPAYEAAQRLGEATGRRIPLAEASSLTRSLHPGERVAVFYTTVEELAVRELRAAASRRGARLIEVGLNTDPLTAQIYGLMIAMMINPSRRAPL